MIPDMKTAGKNKLNSRIQNSLNNT